MPPNPTQTYRTVQLIFKLLLIGGISVGFVIAHYMTDTHASYSHDIYRRVLYIPIILAGFWFGVKGGLLTSVSLTVAYFPHIYHDWGGDVLGANLNRTLEAGMYNVVALITGWLSQRLRQERDQLGIAHRELKDKTLQIFETEEQLRRADRLTALGNLSAGLAHEIRNPLGSIRGTAEILSDKFSPGDEAHEFLQILQNEVARLNQVLTNFLEFARGQQDDEKISSNSCSAAETVNVVLGLLRREIDKKNVEIHLSLESGDDQVAISRDHLNQVILNLLLNALQSVPKCGKIDISSVMDGKQLVFSIADSGPGIPDSLREEVFQPFFTTRRGGTGLGLPMSAKILHGHGATLELTTSHLGGAHFTLLLPLDRNLVK